MTEIYALDVGFPGAGRVLKELSKVFPKVHYHGPKNGLPPMEGEKPILLLPAWHTMYEEVYMNKDWMKPVILWTSPPLQSEMVPQELEYLRKILYFMDTGKIHALWLGDKNWLPLIKKEGRKVFYAPYPVTLPTQRRTEMREKIENVSLFGPLHPRKNVLTQLIAAKMANVFVHVTDTRNLQANSLDSLAGATCVFHDWLSEPEYENLLLDHIDLGLQVSVPGVESFSYVTWDHISRGIPCLTSVDWAPDELRVSNPTDPEAIFAKMFSIVVNDKDSGYWRKYAELYAKGANEKCRETLERELEISL